MWQRNPFENALTLLYTTSFTRPTPKPTIFVARGSDFLWGFYLVRRFPATWSSEDDACQRRSRKAAGRRAPGHFRQVVPSKGRVALAQRSGCCDNNFVHHPLVSNSVHNAQVTLCRNVKEIGAMQYRLLWTNLCTTKNFLSLLGTAAPSILFDD